MSRAYKIACTLGLLLVSSGILAADPPRVSLVRVPDSGIQPAVAADVDGALHVISFRGDPAAGDLFYSRFDPESRRFSAPIRVNSEPGSAIAVGTIRGGQVAIGRDGRVHVAWNGSGKGKTKNVAGSTPMLYSRSNPERTRFEPEKNVMKRTSALDGGGSIAADRDGRVLVAWHGRSEESADGETGRQLYVARSSDDGASFAEEVSALDRPTGACACCGTKSLADRDGNVFILFRSAITLSDRNLFLAMSKDGGKTFTGRSVHPWKLEACPMSSESLAESGGTVVAAWETAGRVYFARLAPKTGTISDPISPEGGKGCKHPSVAINAKGEILLAWTEGTGWQKGGSLAWQVFDRAGKPMGEAGRVEGGIPTWSLPAAAALPDGTFAILH